MKKISEFDSKAISSISSSLIYGGREVKTTLKEEGLSDVHRDNDNDGKWSPGDQYVLIWAPEK
ncbi:hypothetical protein MK851_11790 [Tenacibaculum sp. 1B UA]|uniref:hypothetical protein n=1 Tax=Tenacibaculum sp. 1B UA TaxID=2922252 RepID=UPI002A248A63|nr:hypothetical protein [Tenacibaculum sp. 1B UA]MDX8554302.1 hypothetical protein [Tenacibaculum sp. 1B UA]